MEKVVFAARIEPVEEPMADCGPSHSCGGGT